MVGLVGASSSTVVPATEVENKENNDLADRLFKAVSANNTQEITELLPSMPLDGLLSTLRAFYFAGRFFPFKGKICNRIVELLISLEGPSLHRERHGAWAALLDWAMDQGDFALMVQICEKIQPDCSSLLEKLVKANRKGPVNWLVDKTGYCTDPNVLGRVYVLAISREDVELAQKLVEKIDPNSVDDEGNTLLHYAARLESLAAAQDLYSRMSSGCRTRCNKAGHPAWATAIVVGNTGVPAQIKRCEAIFEFLTSNVTEVQSSVDEMSLKALSDVCVAMGLDRFPQCHEILCERALDIITSSESTYPEDHYGAFVFVLDFLLSKENFELASSVYSKLEEGASACLSTFTYHNRLGPIRWLLKNATLSSEELGQAFEETLQDKKDDVADVFMEVLDPNAVYNYGMTLLHIAVFDSLRVVKCLLEKMSEEAIRQVDEGGKTALDYAREEAAKKEDEWRVKVVELLAVRYSQIRPEESSEEPSADPDAVA